MLNSAEKEYKSYLKDLKLTDLPDQTQRWKRRLGPQLNQRAIVATKVRKETACNNATPPMPPSCWVTTPL